MIKDFIPVEAKINDQYFIWYMDISTLSLNDLVNLKNELKGSKVDSIASLDAVIHQNISWNRQDAKAEKREVRKAGQYKNRKALIRKIRQGR